MGPDVSDQMKTAQRTAVQKLYRKLSIEPSSSRLFCRPEKKCQCLAQGRSYWTGTWPYIGANYGKAKVSRLSIRILFVAMERGAKKAPEKKFTETQKVFRECTESPQNPHMGGTSQLMGCLLEGEGRQSYSRKFALTNAVKCVRRTGNQNSSSTATMISECGEHLREEIMDLRPHLVITQGVHPGKTVVKLFKADSLETFPNKRRGKRMRGEAEVLLANQAGRRFVILTTPHPAHMPGWKWSREWKEGLPKFLQNALTCATSAISGTC
jgi:uracil-DNA glycosylase